MMIINTELKAGEDLFVLIQKIFGKCSSLEHVFLPDGFKKFVSAILEKKKKLTREVLWIWVTNVPSLNFKTCHFTYKRGCYVTVSILLMYFSVAVTVLTHLCFVCSHFCCPGSLFQGHVACRNFLTPTGPHNKISKMSLLFMQLPLVSRMPPFLQPLLKTPKQTHV